MLAITEVLHSPTHFAFTPTTVTSCSSSSSFSSSSSLTCANITPPEADDTYGIVFVDAHIPDKPSYAVEQDGCSTDCETLVKLEVQEEREDDHRTDRLSLFAFLVALFRKSLIACRSDRTELCAMEIGWPTEVRHVAHVTFDRFNGFLGLPLELEPEVPRRPPSASSSVFGVSTESMQLSYDSRGNSVPTILLLMQSRIYSQGVLQGINAENIDEEYFRDQLNRGEVPERMKITPSLRRLLRSIPLILIKVICYLEENREVQFYALIAPVDQVMQVLKGFHSIK